jgi:hypothetical protein
MHRNVRPGGPLGKLARTGSAVAALVAGCLALAPATGSAEAVVLTEELERALFRAADLDGDGFLDEAEFAADIVAAFVGLDTNGDGVLTPDELVGVSAASFARIDTDGDGMITLDELRVQKLSTFIAADRDLTGRVSMAEMLFRSRRPE